MTKTAKKLTSLLFILLGLTPLLFVLVIAIKKQEIWHRMKEELEKGELQTVIVPENEVIWMDDHEIWVNHSMFDIQSKKLENGIYTFTGLYDAEETELVLKERKAAGDTNEENELLARLFKSLPNFCNQHNDSYDPVLFQDSYRFYITSTLLHPFREILTPPPQC